jgi:hypothetical protein
MFLNFYVFCSPIKTVCNALELNSAWIAFASLLVVIGILAANLKELVYFMVKVRSAHITAVKIPSVKSQNMNTQNSILCLLSLHLGLLPFYPINILCVS